ncbi:MAG: hypothetical protein P5681_14495 [Limnospira sp. PMC 894.15]|uniref:hypothetical protein n=1 Tax=unclassified Limnospira TaxID=2642885 RepID=UPI0028E0E610|nr:MULTISPECIES: hypothetical protein [unclassified Limnospira]MDT9189022.1 hypothetical protein [Limnospira sp. PMC 894.15]MDT9234919.1 hypothetical protein [Limnospira sp. PMC 917.15]
MAYPDGSVFDFPVMNGVAGSDPPYHIRGWWVSFRFSGDEWGSWFLTQPTILPFDFRVINGVAGSEARGIYCEMISVIKNTEAL